MTGGASFNQIIASVRPDASYFPDSVHPGSTIEQFWGTVVKPDLISGNLGAGVTIEGAGTANNRIQGALIGTTADGAGPLGNGGPGVLIRDGASSNDIDEIALLKIHQPQSLGDFQFENAILSTIIAASGTSLVPRAGIEITGAGTDNNTVANSFIGANPNDLTQTNLGNKADGVLISAAGYNTIRGNWLSNNARGVEIRDGKTATHNALLGNTIQDNTGDGVLIANGAEGNGIGVTTQGDGYNTLAANPAGGNTIRRNGGYQVRIAGSNTIHTEYNLVSGYNRIESSPGQNAVLIDGAYSNLIGNGGEGQNPGGGYVVGVNPTASNNGNVIGYGAGQYGVVVNQAPSSDGAEGNAILGNAFTGNLANAIQINGYSNIVPPTINSVNVSDNGLGLFTFDIDAAVAAAATQYPVRVDYYLVNPNNPLETHVLGHHIFTDNLPATAPFNVQLTPGENVSGWYVTATATYLLNSDPNNTLKERSATSTLAVYQIA